MMKKQLSFAGLVGFVITLAGFLLGARPLGDNSFLTHLATGRLIWDSHHVPAHDPYTFTVPGHVWVVQSWLVSLLFAAADHLAGFRAIMMVAGVASAALAHLVWRLTAPAESLLSRLGITALVLGVGNSFWVERPLLFGLLAFAALLLAAEGKLKPVWLVPILWLWVNSHGSFPLGLVALGLLAVGRKLDGEDSRVELAALKWAVVGTVAGAINPVGPRLLSFPAELVAKQDVLRNIAEWQAPHFTNLSERVFLLEVALAIAALVRLPRWRSALPLVVFLVAALLGARNVVVASLVLVPGLVAGLAGLGTISGRDRRFVHRPVAMLMAALAVIVLLTELHNPLARVDHLYPVQAVDQAEALGLVVPGKHVITQDFVGNYLELRFGRAANTFIDDRYDLFPASLVDDSATLLHGGPGWQAVLARYHADAVLWEVQQPLAQLLEESPDWRVVYVDNSWLLVVPR